jgi:hypothetical protein
MNTDYSSQRARKNLAYSCQLMNDKATRFT